MTVRYFEDFQMGDRFRTRARTVKDDDIKNFAKLSGDFNPIHLDEEYAKRTAYGTRIAHGLLTLAMTSGLTCSMGLFEESLVAIYGIENLRFVKPVRIGDAITVSLEVTGKREKGETGVVTLSNEVVNQMGETVLVFDKLLLLRKGSETGRASFHSASAQSRNRRVRGKKEESPIPFGKMRTKARKDASSSGGSKTGPSRAQPKARNPLGGMDSPRAQGERT